MSITNAVRELSRKSGGGGGNIYPPPAPRGLRIKLIHSTRFVKRHMMLAKWLSRLFWVDSYYRKKETFFVKMTIFRFCSLVTEPFLGQIWGHIAARALKDLLNALCAVPPSIPVFCSGLSKSAEKGKIWPLMTSGKLTFNLTWKNSFVIIFYTLSNAAYRVLIRGPGAELDGDVYVSTPSRPGAFSTED